MLDSIMLLLITYVVISCYAVIIHAEQKQQLNDPNWVLFPDGDGVLHNVSLKEEAANYIDFFPNDFGTVEFRLYTRHNLDDFQLIDVSNFRNTYFNPLVDTRIIIHGWASNADTRFNSQFKYSYLAKWDANVIVVDWGGLASQFYLYARAGLDAVAVEVAMLLDAIAAGRGDSLGKFHIVGHSLGAHVAGLVGKRVTVVRIASIVGLDPAMPLFQKTDPSMRLDLGDADYVEVMHTSTLGMREPIGHTDFYPNGGVRQPGCGLELVGGCSHVRSLSLYEESIWSARGFWAIQCTSFEALKAGRCFNSGIYMKMGEPTPKPWIRGVYWLQTARETPFSQV